MTLPLILTKTGQIAKNLQNYETLVSENYPNLRINELDRRIYIGDRLLDADDKINVLRFLIQKMNGANLKLGEAEQAIIMAASRNRFNPLKDFLKNLNHSDTNYLDNWLIKVCGTEDTPINRIIGRKWMISAVARIMRPGCYVEGALIFSGEQACGKSRCLKTLCPQEEYFFDSEIDFGNDQKISQSLAGMLIIELAELSSLKKSSIEAVKKTLTATKDTYVPKYQTILESHPRTCVFAGSTNDIEFLVDYTGNRRFWCVEVGEIKQSLLETIKNSLWAEAYRAYEMGEQWTLTNEERIMLEKANDIFLSADPLLDKLLDELKLSIYEDKTEWKASDLDEKLRQLDTAYKPFEWNRISKKLLTQCGWKKQRRENGMMYVLPKGQN